MVSGEIPDVEKLNEVLNTVADKVPALIQGIVASVFSPEAGRNMGKAAAAMYTELTQGGIPEETALEMTRDYLRSFSNISEMMRNLRKDS